MKKKVFFFNLFGVGWLISLSLVWTFIYYMAMFNGDGVIWLDFNNYQEVWVEMPVFLLGFVYTLCLAVGVRRWRKQKRKYCSVCMTEKKLA